MSMGLLMSVTSQVQEPLPSVADAPRPRRPAPPSHVRLLEQVSSSAETQRSPLRLAKPVMAAPASL